MIHESIYAYDAYAAPHHVFFGIYRDVANYLFSLLSLRRQLSFLAQDIMRAISDAPRDIRNKADRHRLRIRSRNSRGNPFSNNLFIYYPCSKITNSIHL